MLKKIGVVLLKIILTVMLFFLFLMLWMGIPEAAGFAGGILVLFFFLHLRKRRNKRYEKIQGGYLKFAGAIMAESDWIRVLLQEEIQRYEKIGLVPAERKARAKRLIVTAVYLTIVFTLLMSCYYRLSVIGWLTVLTVAYMIVYFRIDPLSELCDDARKQPDRAFGEIVSQKMIETPPKSRLLFGIAALLLVLGAFVAFNRTERLTFEPTEGGMCLTNYRPALSGSSRVVTIPDTYEGQPVVAIGKRAFSHNQWMETLHIPDTVTTIDSYAFKKCKSLTDIQLPEGLITLNGESFEGCVALEEITIPTGVSEIRGNTFEGCTSLKTVVLHDGITVIHGYAFRNCSELRHIDLPSGITEIRGNTFENCKSLESIQIPIGVTRIGGHAFFGCTSLRSVFVPDSVREIGSSAFRCCTSLKEIELPAGVAVNERAFKESPTRVLEKRFTDEQILQIRKEITEKNTDFLYYVYAKNNPDAVYLWDEGQILLVDDERFAKQLREEDGLGEMKTYREVLAYLQKAKAAGVQSVLYGSYSKTATELTGEDYFVSDERDIDELIELCRQEMGEGHD